MLVFGKDRLTDVLGDVEAYTRYANGLILWYEDRYEEALAAYDEAIELGLNHPLVYYARALVYEALDRKTDEQNDLLYAYTRQPWLVYARAELAINAFEESDFVRTIQLADLAMTDREWALAYDVAGHANLAQLERFTLKALMKQDAMSSALSRVEHNQFPIRDARLLSRRAMVYAANGKIARAEEELADAIGINERAVAEIGVDDVPLIEKISRQLPQSFAAAFVHALYPAYNEDLQAALVRLKELIDRFQENADAWYQVGEISYLLEDQNSARNACRNAVSLDPNCEGAVFLLGQTMYNKGDLVGLLELANELPSEAYPLIFALRFLKSQGEVDQASEIAYEILDRDPNQIDAILHIYEAMDEDSLEYARMVERLNSQCRFAFRDRYSIAYKFLSNEMPAESLRHFEALLSDGVTSSELLGIPTVLHCGLSRLALNVDSSEPS